MERIGWIDSGRSKKKMRVCKVYVCPTLDSYRLNPYGAEREKGPRPIGVVAYNYNCSSFGEGSGTQDERGNRKGQERIRRGKREWNLGKRKGKVVSR